MNFLGNACLFFAVMIENATCLWFMQEMVYKKERVLKGKEILWLATPVFIITFLETINRAYFTVFSRGMLLLKGLFLCILIFLICKSKPVAAFSIAFTYITMITMAVFFIEALFSIFIEDYQIFDISLMKTVFIRKLYVFLIRIIGVSFAWFVNKQKIEYYAEKFFLPVSIMGYISMMYFYSALRENNKIEKMIVLICLAGVIIIFVLSFFISTIYVISNERAELIQQKNRLLEQELKRFYNLYKENQYLSHDLKNHVAILYQLIERREYQRTMEYLEKLHEPVKEMEDMSVSGNNIIDIILNSKKQISLDKKIKFVLEVDQIGDLPFLDQDVCVMLTNLLDNAMEACENVEDGKRWIQTTIKRDTNVLMFCIANSFQGVIKKKNGKLISNKKEIRRHGIGIESVKYAVDKYGGDMKQEIGDCKFSCSVIFFL